MSFTVEDYSDRELLLILADVRDEEGWASSQEVANRLGMSLDHPRRSVQVRFSWLVRYGVLEREHLRDTGGQLMYTRGGKPKYGQRWRLTEAGEVVALGRLPVRRQELLDALPEGQLVVAVRSLAQRSRQDPVAERMVSREWRYSMSSRRNGGG